MRITKKGKRILSLVLAILLVLSVIPPQITAVDSNDNDTSVIGKTVKLTSSYPWLWTDPNNTNSQVQANASKLPAVMVIVGVHQFSASITLYQLDAAEGYTWPAGYPAENFTGKYWVESTKVAFVEICDKCGAVDCEKVHVFCPYCNIYDCVLEHNDPYQPYIAPVIPENPTLTPGADVSLVDEWGNPVTDSFVVQAGEKYSLSAWPALEGEVSYQWQVCYNNAQMLWVDIYGQTGKGILANASMFASLVDAQNITYLRCVTTNGSETVTSDPIAILLEKAAEQEPVAMLSAHSNRAVFSSDNGDADQIQPQNEVTYAITIKYVMMVEGVEAPNPWVTYLAPGEDYVVNVVPPTMPGFYAGSATGERIERVTDTIINIQSPMDITVYYWPDFMDFKVEHYQQKVGDDSYDLVAVDTIEDKKTGEMVGAALAKTYTGFDALPYDTTITVAADGSTVVKIYYDRQYYMIAIDLNGGYGAEPIYARYETPISIPNPKRTGYTFAGWKNEKSGQIEKIVETMPIIPEEDHFRITYQAQWTKANTKVTVAFWYENANDINYTFVGSIQLDAVTGSTISGSDYVALNSASNATHFNGYDAEYAQHFSTLNADKTDKNVVVKADGSSVLNVYFYRNTYTLTYLRKQCLHTHGNGCTYCSQGRNNHTHVKGCVTNIVRAASTITITPYLPKNPSSGQTERYLGFWFVYLENTWWRINGYDEPSWNSNCPRYEHAHSSNCCTHVVNAWDCPCRTTNAGWNVVHSQKYKFEADVGDVHKAMEALNNGIRWIPKRGEKVFATWSSDNWGQGTAVGTFTAMPGGDVTFNEGGAGSIYFEITYWLETYDGSGTKDYKGRNFAQGTTFSVRMGNVAYLDEFTNGMPQGFERYYATYGSSFGDDSGGTIPEGGRQNTHQYNNFYYIRETFVLEYVNAKDVVATRTLKYDEPLTSTYNLQNISMTSPNGPGYSFAGWYLDPECTIPVSWGTTRMPDGGTSGSVGLRVYAKWEPIKHTVKVYLTKEDMLEGELLENYGPYEINHGDTFANVYQDQTVPIPDNGSLSFIGWFYEEDGKEVAYDFSMPVYRNMNLYAKWNSNVVTYGTIYYVDTNGNELARPIRVTGTVGDTKTYSAKPTAELGDGKTLYFPDVTSHSIKFVANPDQNTFTFVYTALPEVSYTIKFVNKDNPSEELFPEVTGTAKTATIVYDAQAAGMTKDKYYLDKNSKEFALSSDESKNVFYFYYTYDPGKATVQVEHYIERLDGSGYDFHSESPATVEELETLIKAADRKVTINGFTYSYATFNGVRAEEQTLAGGLTIKLYYTRNSYSYTIKFVYTENGVQKEFPNSAVTGTAKYRDNIVQEAKKFAGWKPDASGKSIFVDYKESNNTYTFYYTEEGVEFHYSVGAVQGGSVSSTGETVNAVSGNPNGSTATPKDGNYKFTGWYTDYACSPENRVSTNATFTPTKNGDIFVSKTYYAGFEEVKVTINYKVQMPAGAQGQATLDKYSESVSVITGKLEGSKITNTPNGYEFAGWYDANDTLLSTDPNYVPPRTGNPWVDGTTFIAKFVEKKATIRYEAIGPGNVSSAEEIVEMLTGNANGATASIVENYGKFVGWYSDATCTQLVSNQLNFNPTIPDGGWAESQTYYAKFEFVEYTITFVDRNQTVSTQEYYAGNTLNLPAVTNGNYRLTWKVKSTDGNWTDALLQEFLNGEPIVCYGNVTVEAVWTIDVYWVDWNATIGSFDFDDPDAWPLLDQKLNVPFGTEHIYNGELPTREDPEGKYTYTFSRWVEVDLSLFEAYLGDKINGIVIYQAEYTKIANSASLTINVQGCDEVLDPNQSFLFSVTGEDGVNLQVGIVENGSVVIDGLTIGKEYTITIENDWSWRYESKQDQISAAKDTDGAKTANSIKITLEEGEVVTFTVTRENQWWLDGNSPRGN